MNGYLARLISRPAAGADGLARPAFRSGSPLVDRDQRTTVPGFEEIGDVFDAHSGPAAFDSAAGGEASAREVREISMPVRPGAGPVERGAGFSADVNASADRALRAPDLSAGSTPSIQMPPASAFPPEVERDGRATHAAARARPFTGEEVVDTRPDASVEPPAPDSVPRRPPFKSLPEIVSTVVQQREHASRAEPQATRVPREARAPAPTVEIGRISVEVVRAPEPKTAAEAARGPLTADSVSVIGRLGGRVRGAARLRLRHG